MTLTRIVFLALAVLLPTAWTAAKAEDAPPAEGAKKESKKKGKKKGGEEAPKEAK